MFQLVMHVLQQQLLKLQILFSWPFCYYLLLIFVGEKAVSTVEIVANWFC